MIRKLERDMSEYMTKQRRYLLQFLQGNADRHLTAREICEELQKEGISQSAVYRNLAFLEREGALLKSAGDNRENVYRYIAAGDCAACLHLTCTTCGGIFHLRNNEAERLEKNILSSDSFFMDRKKTVIYGICKKCR